MTNNNIELVALDWKDLVVMQKRMVVHRQVWKTHSCAWLQGRLESKPSSMKTLISLRFERIGDEFAICYLVYICGLWPVTIYHTHIPPVPCAEPSVRHVNL